MVVGVGVTIERYVSSPLLTSVSLNISGMDFTIETIQCGVLSN